MVTIELTPAHGLPMAVAICSVFVNTWAGFWLGQGQDKVRDQVPSDVRRAI
ncbi:unnamed protein product [Ectocarpus sp. 8 AP-2014]